MKILLGILGAVFVCCCVFVLCIVGAVFLSSQELMNAANSQGKGVFCKLIDFDFDDPRARQEILKLWLNDDEVSSDFDMFKQYVLEFRRTVFANEPCSKVYPEFGLANLFSSGFSLSTGVSNSLGGMVYEVKFPVESKNGKFEILYSYAVVNGSPELVQLNYKQID